MHVWFKEPCIKFTMEFTNLVAIATSQIQLENRSDTNLLYLAAIGERDLHLIFSPKPPKCTITMLDDKVL